MTRPVKSICMACAVLMAAAVGACASCLGAPAAYGRAIVSVLCQASTVLFGIFGVWLGICYHDDIDASLDGLRGEELRRKAKDVVLVTERCRVLFNGLTVAAFIFVFALAVDILAEPVARLLAGYRCAGTVVKMVFFVMVFECALAQIYSILSPVAIMAEAMLKITAARDKADDMLGRLPPGQDGGR